MIDYPLLYHAHHCLRADDLPFWESLASKFGGPILELGCGTGRVLSALAGLGYPVTGLDNDPDMLAFLRKNLLSEPHSNLRVVEADMVDFDLKTTFPLIILPCNTFSTFSSATRLVILQTAVRHLASGGVFAFSIPNPGLLAGLPPEGEPDLEDTFPHPGSGHPVEVFSSWRVDPGGVTFFWRYDHLIPGKEASMTYTSTTHMLDHGDVYLAELHAAGLKLLEIYGDFDQSPFTSQSNYMIVLASPRPV